MTGIQEYEKKFGAILTNQTPILDFSEEADQFTKLRNSEDFEIFKNELLQRKNIVLMKENYGRQLKEMLETFKELSHRSPLKIFSEKRAKTVVTCLKKWVPEKKMREDFSVKNSHLYIFLIWAFLKLLMVC